MCTQLLTFALDALSLLFAQEEWYPLELLSLSYARNVYVSLGILKQLTVLKSSFREPGHLLLRKMQHLMP